MAKSEIGDGKAAEIMKQVHALYAQPDEGVIAMARSVGITTIHPPRRKVNVLVIGNHSAGKSSFINWYIGDDVQRTGVAIETQGFTFVTSGSKKTLAPIKGDSTVMLYPYLEPLKEKFGKPLIENLQTCVSVSTKRSFPMVRMTMVAMTTAGHIERHEANGMLNLDRWTLSTRLDWWTATSRTRST